MAAFLTVYIVDACALMAYFRSEAGKDKFKDLLLDPLNVLKMHAINLGEVYYNTWRDFGVGAADIMLQDVRQLPIRIVPTVDEDLMKRAARFKVENRVSYADSFVLALAEKENGVVLTTDHHEFDAVEQKGQIKFYWLR
jgi:PIN domain nuclease of toxin-antitoxin system